MGCRRGGFIDFLVVSGPFCLALWPPDKGEYYQNLGQVDLLACLHKFCNQEFMQTLGLEARARNVLLPTGESHWAFSRILASLLPCLIMGNYYPPPPQKKTNKALSTWTVIEILICNWCRQHQSWSMDV